MDVWLKGYILLICVMVDPVEQAKIYEEGADELVFLDISATPEGKATVIDIVSQVANQVFMPLTVGDKASAIPKICVNCFWLVPIRSASILRRYAIPGCFQKAQTNLAVNVSF